MVIKNTNKKKKEDHRHHRRSNEGYKWYFQVQADLEIKSLNSAVRRKLVSAPMADPIWLAIPRVRKFRWVPCFTRWRVIHVFSTLKVAVMSTQAMIWKVQHLYKYYQIWVASKWKMSALDLWETNMDRPPTIKVQHIDKIGPTKLLTYKWVNNEEW